MEAKLTEQREKEKSNQTQSKSSWMILIPDKKSNIYYANDLLIISYRVFQTVCRRQAELGVLENDQQRPASAQR